MNRDQVIYDMAERYQGLFNFFNQEHELILTVGEMDDIIRAVEEHKKAYVEHDIRTPEGARAYLESEGIDVDRAVKKGLKNIKNLKYRKVYFELEKFVESTWLELQRVHEWHFRITADEDNILDIYPKKKKYCKVKEAGMVNNNWGRYDELIPLVKEFFKIE